MKTLLNLLNRTANAVKISGGGSSRTTKHLFAIVTLLLTFGVGNTWASNAHHCLIGEPIATWKTTDNWSKSYEEFALTSPANTKWDEFCIYMWVETNQTFAFNNHFFNPGDAKQVGPSSDQATLNNDGGAGTQLISAAGEWTTSAVEDYLDASHHWIHAGMSTTLYAKWSEDAHYKTNPQAYKITKKTVTSETQLQLFTAAGGGCAIKIEPKQ